MNILGNIAEPGPAPEDPPTCSARGCRQTACWAVVWNNPKIHTPDREKVWTACGDHRRRLSDFVDARGMLKRVDPLPG